MHGRDVFAVYGVALGGNAQPRKFGEVGESGLAALFNLAYTAIGISASTALWAFRERLRGRAVQYRQAEDAVPRQAFRGLVRTFASAKLRLLRQLRSSGEISERPETIRRATPRR